MANPELVVFTVRREEMGRVRAISPVFPRKEADFVISKTRRNCQTKCPNVGYCNPFFGVELDIDGNTKVAVGGNFVGSDYCPLTRTAAISIDQAG